MSDLVALGSSADCLLVAYLAAVSMDAYARHC